MNKTIKILRWIAILPFSIITSMLCFVLMYYSDRFFSGGDTKIFSISIFGIIGFTVSGALFNISGTKMAPSKKKIVSLVLLIYICVSALLIIWTYYKAKEYESIIDALFLALGSLIGYRI